jgi:hypothetical protein
LADLLLPTDPENDASNAAAAACREIVGRVFVEMFGAGEPAWLEGWTRDE